LVGTPGRLMDFANNKDIHLDQVEVLVIDEADRMLDMGFIPQVRRLVRLTPPREDRQTLLFSATFTPEVLRLSEQWTDKPVMLEMEPERVATDTVEQKIFITTASEKFNLLQNILRDEAVDSVMVFANRRDICRTLYERLKKQGFRVGLIAGDVPQNRRMKTLESFKNGSLKVMVATDVAGRGIHVNGVSHVVNFTLPEEPEDYVHRIGRTGRAGQTGISVSFACEDDAFLLEPIEKLLDMKLPCTMPDEALLADVPAPVRKRPPAAKKDAPAADTSSPKAVKEEPASKEPVSKKPVSKEPAAKDTVEAELVEETPVEEKSAEVKPLEEKAVEEQPVQDEPSKSEPVEEQQSPKQAQEKPE
jgi:ATP-dependent RNA helicase RhlB